LQYVSYAGQVQTPALQLPLPQFVPHAPQFCESVDGLTHLPPQST